ncbi:hypothetical protein AVEN_65942-1 [Araneus ventricosus]|uniref:Uncharacterized protein n=1 Tax=Araneus ventricosus TaxID=182803 RepID=A0A4Y2QA08_ARAVE|nr:hypothetical protein AVEN_9237-1 [Araneus ventricosus]GBN60371.1 hypothetical protein AVEN_233353-1 [Araneus ventricosus]GBN60399.1 hypothetical protein AVEN_218467-1 [Araneus ventricosus]GBN60416.1 hypothetical protein AVEN_65942-1 [Araneus ventricosus]
MSDDCNCIKYNEFLNEDHGNVITGDLNIDRNEQLKDLMNKGKTKEHHPTLPKHPGKQLKDRPPQQIVGHYSFCIIATIKSGSCSNPPFYRGATRHRKWGQRATPPLLCHRVDESLLTYMAASPPRTHGVPPME